MWLSAVRCAPVLLGAPGELDGHAGPSSGDSAEPQDATWHAGTETQGLGNLRGQVRDSPAMTSRGERGKSHTNDICREVKNDFRFYFPISLSNPLVVFYLVNRRSACYSQL